jgi:hypothetical protein
MTAAALIARLDVLGVSITMDGTALRLRPASVIPADLLSDLRLHKSDLVALLAPNRENACGPEAGERAKAPTLPRVISSDLLHSSGGNSEGVDRTPRAIVAPPRSESRPRSAQDWQVFFDEHVAVAVSRGGVSRPEAEARAFECCVVQWMNDNLVCSPPGRCLACGGSNCPDELLPFGVEPVGQAWLHPRCWPAWYAGLKAEAAAAIRAMGITPTTKIPDAPLPNDGMGPVAAPNHLAAVPHCSIPAGMRAGKDILESVRNFSFNGEATREENIHGLLYLTNEFWTSGQRQAHSIHEISYTLTLREPERIACQSESSGFC